MIPLLSVMPSMHQGPPRTWFALMASLMNMALVCRTLAPSISTTLPVDPGNYATCALVVSWSSSACTAVVAILGSPTRALEAALAPRDCRISHSKSQKPARRRRSRAATAAKVVPQHRSGLRGRQFQNREVADAEEVCLPVSV